MGKDISTLLPIGLDIFSGLQSAIDNFRMKNDPNVRALRNINIGNMNQVLSEGGSVNPYSALSNYSAGQISGAQENVLNPLLGSLSGINGKTGSGGGDFALPDLSSALGDTSMYDKPYETTLSRSGQNQQLKPIGPGLVEQAGNWLGNLFGGDKSVPSYEVGTTSVPQDGLAMLHQGEAVVPASQNPAAMPPGVPGQPMEVQSGGIQPIPAPTPAPQPSQSNLQPNNNLPAPGLNPQALSLLQRRGDEQIGSQLQAQQRQIAEQAAAQGNAFGGVPQNQLFQARLAADQASTNLGRDLAIQAEDRRFADEMARAQFGLNQQLGLGGLQQGNRSLALQEMLGQGNLGVAQQQANTARELGLGNLGLGQQQLQQQGYLGQQQLNQGQQALDTNRQVQLGQLGLGQQQQDLARQLGLGNLNLGQQQLNQNTALQNRGLDLQSQYQQGQLGLGQQAQNTNSFLARLQQQLGLGGLDLQRQQQQFQQGAQFNEQNRQFDVQQQLAERLGLGQLGLAGRGLDLQELVHQNDVQFGQFDRATNLLQNLLGRNDQLAGINAQANQGQEEFLQQLMGRLYGDSSLPTAVGV